MTKNKAFEVGREMGGKAYAAGLIGAPAVDVNVRNALPGLPVKVVIALLSGWHLGWAESHVAAPVP
jgi:hypothetical protein